MHRERGHRLYAVAHPLLAGLMPRIAYRIAVSDAAARRTVASHFAGRYEAVPNGIDVGAFRSPRGLVAAQPAEAVG